MNLSQASDEELFGKLCAFGFGDDREQARKIMIEMLTRIERKSGITEQDVCLVNEVSETAEELCKTDSDLIDSANSDNLGERFYNLQQKLLSRMRGEEIKSESCLVS